VGSFWMAFTLSLSQKKYLKIKEMEWLRIRSHMSTVFVIHPCAGVRIKQCDQSTVAALVDRAHAWCLIFISTAPPEYISSVFPALPSLQNIMRVVCMFD
jgi:organic hydroperoxide reductase OsmC/OhrA